MSLSFDPHTIPILAKDSLQLTRTLLAVRQQEFTVTLDDGPLVITGKWLMVNIFLWRSLVKRGLSIQQRHTLFQGLVTKERLAKVQTEIYNDVIQHYQQRNSWNPIEERAILYDLTDIINDLHTMVATQLGEYHLSVSAFDLADLLAQPKIAPLTKVNLDRELQISITAAEDKLAKAGHAMMTALLDKTIPNNIIAPFLELGILNTNQLARVFVAAGFRTDASDNLVRLPIQSSFIDGMKDIREFAVDSLDAKKAIYYSKSAMPDTQYNSRKQQLLSSVIAHLYPGDCGSSLTVPYYIHKDNARNVLDKNIIDQGQMVRLTRANIDSYIDSTVHLRSPLTCRYTDGFCHTCGGHLTAFMPPHLNPGIVCSVEYMGQAASLVLSVKHFSRTSAIMYKVPEPLHDLLIVKQDDIYIRPNIDTSHLKLGIQIHDMPQINDLQYLEDEGAIGEQQFSRINYLTFATDQDIVQPGEVAMISDTTVPYLSSEMLAYIKDRFKSIEIGDMIWVPLKAFDHINEPLLKCVIESSSMIKFIASLTRFMITDIRKYTSLTEVLRDFTALVYKQIDTNLMHLEVVLKSYLITDEINYNVPIVTDVENVRFNTLGAIIPRRSLGGQFAYERLAEVLEDPTTFILPHRKGIFDVFFFADEASNHPEMDPLPKLV